MSKVTLTSAKQGIKTPILMLKHLSDGENFSPEDRSPTMTTNPTMVRTHLDLEAATPVDCLG